MKAKKEESGAFRVRVYVGQDEKGKHYKSFTGKTKKDAEKKAIEWQELNTYDEIGSKTLKIAYERYIMSKTGILSPSTLREYLRAKNRDFEGIMFYRCDQVTNEMIQREVAKLSQRVSPKSVRNAYGLLMSVLKFALPSRSWNIQLPQQKKTEFYIPTDDEIRKLIETAKGTDLYIPVLLGAFAPMRRSEICASSTDDFDGKNIIVNKALVQDKNGEWVVKQPKTINGYRSIPLPKIVCDALNDHTGKLYDKSPNALTHAFEHLVHRAGITPIHFHSLRHYCASYLAYMGVPLQAAAKRGGWVVETLQKVYQHAMRDKDIEYYNKVNEAFDKIVV